MAGNIIGRGQIFQSTLPGWGATVRLALWDLACRVFQSTLPGWGATTRSGSESPLPEYFNPRSPDGERLFQPVLEDDGTDISIHAPRMGSDLGFSLFIQWSKDFNPRSPDGERPEIVRRLLETVFISIHAPRMGSDRLRFETPQIKAISIHAPRMGSDPSYR